MIDDHGYDGCNINGIMDPTYKGIGQQWHRWTKKLKILRRTKKYEP